MRPLFFSVIMCIMTDKPIREQHRAEYRAWRNMRQRCCNKKAPNYGRYGGRGIKICNQWESFEVFLEDMGLRPTAGHTLERRDNDADYEPGNCYWATRDVQVNNTRRNVKLEFDGQALTIAQWSKKTGIPYDTIRARYRYGWPTEEILRTALHSHTRERKPDKNSRYLVYAGQKKTIAQWARLLDINYDTLRGRLRYGWSVERALEEPEARRRS